jgi:hypothetical protein
MIEKQSVTLFATVMAKLRNRADLDIPIGAINFLQFA